jgi:hypothetical protein
MSSPTLIGRQVSGADAIAVQPVALGARQRPADRTSDVSDAHAALLVHVRGRAGLCVGCLDCAWFALSPCPTARTFWSIVETHGVSEWDPVWVSAGSVGACSVPGSHVDSSVSR